LNASVGRLHPRSDGGPIDREEIAADLERARAQFHRLLNTAGPDDWRRPSHGTKWNNEELLFHMVFGYMAVQRLMLLMRVFGRLPDPVSAVFARTLNTMEVPFHAVNYHGSCAAARVYNRCRMGPKLDRVINSLQQRLTRDSDKELRLGMHYPTRWDPFFLDYMTIEDLYRYPGQHFDFHARQLTLTGVG
jgi:hypothetical protein